MAQNLKNLLTIRQRNAITDLTLLHMQSQWSTYMNVSMYDILPFLKKWELTANRNQRCPRFFDQVGHETMYASSGNKHFFTKSCHRQTYQNYEQPPQTSQNSYFQSHFSVLKIGRIFPNFFFMKNIWLGDQLLSKNVLNILIFKRLYFLKLCPIFVGSVHNFGKSDNDKI